MNITKLNEPARQMPLWLWGFVIAVAIYYSWELLAGPGARIGGDTYNYFNAAANLANIHTDKIRPPVYPAILLACRGIFGPVYGLVAVALLQWCAWVLSMRLLWGVCAMTGAGRLVSAAVILCQCAFREVVMINSTLLTESFAMSGVIAMMYLCCRMVRDYAGWQMACASVLLFLMIFLKPVFLILIPILAVFYLSRRRHMPSDALFKGLGAIGIVVVAVGIYSQLMYRSYGFRSMTVATVINDYHDLRMNGLVIPDELDEPLRSRFAPYYAADKGTDRPDYVMYFSEGFDLSTYGLTEAVDRAGSLHRREYVGVKLRKFVRTLTYSVFWLRYDSGRDEFQPDQYTHDPYFPYWGALLIFSGYMFIGLRRWYRSRRFPAILYMPAAVWAAMYFASIWGSHDEWSRLILPALPCMFVMAGVEASAVMRRYLKASGDPETNSLT